MTDNVVDWNGITRLDSDPQAIIERARQAGMTGVVIVGYNADGSEFFASSYADGGNVIWCLERAKHRLLTITDKIAEEGI